MIHRVAEIGFSRSSDAYERARPEYPPEAIALLAARASLRPGRTVLDLAAGTGKLTRPLLETGATVIAVEPVREMRAALPEEEARVLEGTAEAIPLDDVTCDAVTVGQAFHWFDGDRALAEIHRVLRPGGLLALVWNRRLDDPLHDAIEKLIAPHRRDAPAHRSGAWREAFSRTSLFGPLEEDSIEHEHELDGEGLADRVASTSFIAALEEAERERVLDATRELAAGGHVQVRYVCELQVCRRR